MGRGQLAFVTGGYGPEEEDASYASSFFISFVVHKDKWAPGGGWEMGNGDGEMGIFGVAFAIAMIKQNP